MLKVVLNIHCPQLKLALFKKFVPLHRFVFHSWLRPQTLVFNI
jgi:hypothetical protein